MDQREIFRTRLAEVRKSRGLTQAELAEKSGLPPATVSHFETGFRFPTAPTLTKIADALKISIDFLVGRDAETGEVGERYQALFRNAENLSNDSLKILEALSKQLQQADKERRKGE